MDTPHKGYIRQEGQAWYASPRRSYDSGNEPSDKDELREYQSRFGVPIGTQGEAGQSSTQPPPPKPSPAEDSVSPSTTLEDQVEDLTARFDAYWDETVSDTKYCK